MIPSQIEKEILIDAPVDVVWRVLTQPDQIKRWFSDEAQLDLRAGGDGRLSWTTGTSFGISVEAVDPPLRFAFRWLYPDGSTPDPGNSTLVEFTLRSEGDGTRLVVVESGFDTIDWSDEKKARRLEQNTQGWEDCLARLQKVASRLARTPGPA